MADILQTIIAAKYVEVEHRKKYLPLDILKTRIAPLRKHHSLKDALMRSQTGIISEFKRRSPSKGWINRDADPAVVVPGYAAAGASAISILTDGEFFGGSLDDIRAARPLVDLPILRKDFVIDEYQLYEAAEVGADVVLLIAAALTPDKCARLANKAHECGLEVLLEIHDANELKYISEDIDVVGVNNRNLGTFVTSVDNSFALASLLPSDKVMISESGISHADTIVSLRDKAGYKGFLIGETFMKTPNPPDALSTFIHEVTHLSNM